MVKVIVDPVLDRSLDLGEIDQHAPRIDSAANRSAHLGLSYGYQLIDLKSFAGLLIGSSLPDSVKEAAAALEDANAPDDYVLAEGHLGPPVDTCGGISAYYPNPVPGVSPVYGDLRLSKEHSWAELLEAIAQARLAIR